MLIMSIRTKVDKLLIAGLQSPSLSLGLRKRRLSRPAIGLLFCKQKNLPLSKQMPREKR